MLKRTSTLLVTGLFLFSIFSFLGVQKAEAKRYRYIKIRYRGSYRYARVYINGRYRGKVYRNRTKRIYTRAGKWYRIRLKYGGRTAYKRIYLSRSSNRYVVFYSPGRSGRRYRGSSRGRYRYRTLVIKYRGRYSYARLYINGSYKGKIRKHRSRRYRRRTGRWYTIKTRRFGRTHRRRVYLSYSRSAPYYVYMSRP